ncbi:MAG: PQQ-binding-like beta-propeller repeat protein [Rhodospirillales bacterium]|nr:PQQ-binding-like beta-propeller repeat protein [Rhodospirillales bacterium]MCB9996287.1 PQQ-binding-like beta-propeller repeat protein [Rhodospirillales bacterium]
MSSFRRFVLGFAALTVLTGCSSMSNWLGDEKDAPLEGERISILELQKNLEPDSAALEGQGFVAPAAWRNEFWPQAGGYPNHVMQHLQLGQDLNPLWTAKIGKGSTKELPLTAQPIVVDGRIFTLDTDSNLSGFSAETGEEIWQIDVRDPEEDDPVIGGGISYSRGVLYVTNGYDELLAVSPVNGELVWRVPLPAPSRAAPTIMDERIFVTTLDNQLLALDRENGQILWDYAGISESAGLVGAASPAASREIIIPAFSSGEILAVRVENGAVVWTENLSSFSHAGGLAGISDIRGLPVVDKGLVIAISFGGRMTAIDERTGTRIWQREIGGSETPWIAGNHVFVISTENEMVALGRDNGVIRWVTQLPRYKDMEDRKGPIYWTGPVLAGERLIAASSDGGVAEVNPQTGEIVRMWDGDGKFRLAPVIAGEILYLLSEDGTLMAFR